MRVRIFQLRHCHTDENYDLADTLGFYSSFEGARQMIFRYFDEDEKILEESSVFGYAYRVHTNKNYTYMIDWSYLYIDDVNAFFEDVKEDAIDDGIAQGVKEKLENIFHSLFEFCKEEYGINLDLSKIAD